MPYSNTVTLRGSCIVDHDAYPAETDGTHTHTAVSHGAVQAWGCLIVLARCRFHGLGPVLFQFERHGYRAAELSTDLGAAGSVAEMAAASS
eukprot:SAG11_NODE_13458_length_654_cov_1.477477_1_plen_90_part_01